jgi:hypothetical protein
VSTETLMTAHGGAGPTEGQTRPAPACCGNCRYALDRDPATVFCRRYPPVPVYVPGVRSTVKGQPARAEDIAATFPVMQALHGWCGEHA